MNEHVLLTEGGVLVSSTRFVTPSATYATAQISSIRTGAIVPSKMGPGCIMTMGAFVLLGALGTMLDSVEGGLCGLTIGTAVSGLGYYLYRRKVPTYYLYVRTTAGEVPALSHTDWATISRAADALNRAIIARG